MLRMHRLTGNDTPNIQRATTEGYWPQRARGSGSSAASRLKMQ